MSEAPENLVVSDSAGDLPLDLWRGFSGVAIDASIFTPLLQAEMRKGGMRAADVTYDASRNGEPWVMSPGGLSLFDRPGVFRGNHWRYFKVPKGTAIPPGLALIKGSFRTKLEATHYSISPTQPMPLRQFLADLDQLRLNAMARSTFEVSQ